MSVRSLQTSSLLAPIPYLMCALLEEDVLGVRLFLGKDGPIPAVA